MESEAVGIMRCHSCRRTGPVGVHVDDEGTNGSYPRSALLYRALRVL
jgi:hypothetical protein